MRVSIRLMRLSFAAVFATIMTSSTGVRAFDNLNMNTQISVNEKGQILVQWHTAGFDEYHVGWRVNGGPRGERTRPGDKLFTVLMRYTPGSVYEVGVQGCTKHTIKHDQCTSWDTVTCGQPGSPCAGSIEAMPHRLH